MEPSTRDHIHPDQKVLGRLYKTLADTVPLKALTVPLGAWRWRPETHEAPRWELLQKAPLWTDVYYGALRRRLAAEMPKWHVNPASGQVVRLLPERCHKGAEPAR